MMVTFTDKAIDKFREFLGTGNINGIRIFIAAGG
jgi:Fe-S cluster assembly iron-binding protein IscA